MRRTISICAGALALATTLTACGGGDDDASGAPVADGDALVVEARDSLAFDRTEYQAPAGEVEVRYRNDGSLPHTLLIEGVDDFKLSVGDEDRGTVALEPGTYTIYCDVSGHQGAGMEAELTVS